MTRARDPQSQSAPDPLREALARVAPQLEAYAALQLVGGRVGPHTPEDIVQSACRQLLTISDRIEFRGEAALRGLLERIIGQKISEKRRFHRAARRDGGRNLPEATELLPETKAAGPDRDAEFAELRAALAAALAELPRADAEIVLLRGMLGLDHAEIAARFGITLATARARLRRARQRLRGQLERRGWDPR